MDASELDLGYTLVLARGIVEERPPVEEVFSPDGGYVP